MSVAIDEIRARRHPRAIFLAWMFVALSGLALAWPAAAGVGREFRGSFDGDAPLFQSGSLDLLDYLWRARGVITADVGHVVVLFPLVLIGAVVPLALLLAAIGGVSGDRFAPRAGRIFGVLVALDLGVLVIQVLTFWGFFTLAAVTASGLTSTFGAKGAELCGAAVLALGALLIIAISMLRDVAAATTVALATGAAQSIFTSLRVVDREGAALLWAWTWRSCAGWLPVVLATLLATKIGGKSGLLLLILMISHQAALALKMACRASWLAASLRAVARASAPKPDALYAADAEAARSDR